MSFEDKRFARVEIHANSTRINSVDTLNSRPEKSLHVYGHCRSSIELYKVVQLIVEQLCSTISSMSRSTVTLTDRVVLSENLTIPSTQQTVFQGDGSYYVPEGAELNIEGPVSIPEWQVFYGPGKVNLAKCPVADFRVEWFGAIADGKTPCDDAFDKCQAAMSTPKSPYAFDAFGRRVILNAGSYIFKRPFELNRAAHWLGQAPCYDILTTRFDFAPNTAGIRGYSRPFTKDGGAAHGACLENIAICGSGSLNPDAHGLYMGARMALKNVYVGHFAGNGVHIEADTNRVREWNANYASIDRLTTHFNCGNGLYIFGCDTNMIRVSGLDAQYNGKWGVWEYSFLGVYFEYPHCALNGRLDPKAGAYAIGLNPYAADIYASVQASKSILVGPYAENNTKEAPSMFSGKTMIYHPNLAAGIHKVHGGWILGPEYTRMTMTAPKDELIQQGLAVLTLQVQAGQKRPALRVIDTTGKTLRVINADGSIV
jgi:hypothetical protein